MTTDLPNSVADVRICPSCGYDLRGLASDRCPECGLPIDAAADLTVTLPWVHRRQIGRVRAYVRTVGLSGFRPWRLAANVAHPVSWPDAVAFRRVTVGLAAGSLALVATTVAILPSANFLFPAVHHPFVWWAELLTVPVAWAGLYLAVLTSTGVASYWFHPRSVPVAQQDRAVALSYYACGSLALVPLIAGCLFGLALIALADSDAPLAGSTGLALGTVAAVVAAFVMARWWWATVSLLGRTTHCGIARRVCLAVVLPVAWAVLVAVFAVGLPAAWLWLAVVVKSFQLPG